MGTLDNQLAILTVGDAQLAFPLAQALTGAGARLALVTSNESVAVQLTDRLPSGSVQAYTASSSLDSVQSTVSTILLDHGTPDILVTVPLRPAPKSSLELSEADFQTALDDGLLYAFRWSQAVGRLMVGAGHGVIVHVTGLWALGGWPGWLAGSAAFGAIHNLTHTLAVEWATSKVRVNCLVPGITPVIAAAIESSPVPRSADAIARRIPAGRQLSDNDLAQALLYLVDPMAGYVSGEVLQVDGGWDKWGRLYAVAAKG